MRFSPSLVFAAIAVNCVLISHSSAQEGTLAAERLSARRDLELAKMELRHYWQIEYPRQQRELNAAIELTRLEIDNLRFRLRQYQPFTRFSTGDPFMVTIQNTQICLRGAELRFRDLLAERSALVRFHSDQYRELELRVHEARLRVMELEPREERQKTQLTGDPSI